MSKTSDLKVNHQQEFKDYLKQTILETNKLSYKEIEKLCLEYFRWVYPRSAQMPDIKIGIGAFADSVAYQKCRFEHIWQQLVNIVEEYIKANNISPENFKDFDIDIVKEFGIILPFSTGLLSRKTGCGALNKRFYMFIYYFDFLGVPIKNETLKRFWNFYKKTMNVYAMGMHSYSSGLNYIYVTRKPDEIFIKDNVTHCKYGRKYYCDGVRVEPWLYRLNKDNADLEKFAEIKNADYRSIFMKKAGIENQIKLVGEIVDSYENYPENEWWAKSEYKLVDMKKVTCKEIIKSEYGTVLSRKNYDYAPYLFMKNQTTGEYHLEGVSPDCKDLYDAIKMRYKGLDLPKYKIENIK